MADTPAPVAQAASTLQKLADKDADSVDSNARYMAYGARLRTALRATHRYIAYVREPSSRGSCCCWPDSMIDTHADK